MGWLLSGHRGCATVDGLALLLNNHLMFPSTAGIICSALHHQTPLHQDFKTHSALLCRCISAPLLLQLAPLYHLQPDPPTSNLEAPSPNKKRTNVNMSQKLGL
ncbi:unnamed protein product [Brassica rapa]|uniref:Uncharacterized protein n=1 Tax=Brassica campestris TaxID=3711 RepID=A0A8D9HQ74_BRACM|nr:unnamed protein product [Brassica rapa]